MSVLLTSAFIILTPQELLSSLHLSLILQMGTQSAVCPPEPDFSGTLAFGSQWNGHCQHNMNLVLFRARSSRWHCSSNKPRLQSLWVDWNQLTQVLAGSSPSPEPCPPPWLLTLEALRKHSVSEIPVSALISAACKIQILGKEPHTSWGQGRGPGHQIMPCEGEH